MLARIKIEQSFIIWKKDPYNKLNLNELSLEMAIE